LGIFVKRKYYLFFFLAAFFAGLFAAVFLFAGMGFHLLSYEEGCAEKYFRDLLYVLKCKK